MIHINNLSLTNFMCISSAQFDFSNNFVTLFVGDPGQGKSTVFEAIALCFTERRKGDTYKDYIKHGESFAKVELQATISNEPISFNIEISEKSSTVSRTIIYKNKTYTNSECSMLLKSFDLDYLQHNMFSMQKEGSVIDLRPAERAKLLKRIFSVEFPSQIEYLVTEIEKATHDISILQAQIDVLSNRTFIYQSFKEELSEEQRNDISKKINNIKAEIKAIEHLQLLNTELNKGVESLREQYYSLVNRKNNTEKEISKSKIDLLSLQSNIKKYQETINNLPDINDCTKEIEKYNSQLTQVQTIIENSTQDIINIKNNIFNTNNEIEILKKHIKAHKEGICVTCGQTTQPEKVPLLEEKLEELKQVIIDLTKLEEEASRINREGVGNQKEYEKEITSLTEKIRTHNTLKPRYVELLDNSKDEFSRVEEKIDSLSLQVVEYEAQLIDLQTKINESSIKPTGDKELNDLQSKIAILNNEIQSDNINKSINATIASHNDLLKQEEENNKKEIERARTQQNTLSLNISSYKEAKKILEVDLPNYIIVKMCSKLESNINRFIASVMPNMVVQLFQSKSGVEFFYSPNGVPVDITNWTSTKMASGFEGEVLSVAWRVALAQAYKLKVLLLDEIDSAANPISSEKMFRKLVNFSDFDQLFLISHKPELLEVLQQEVSNIVIYRVREGSFFQQEY